MLSNAYLLAKIGFDTAENEPAKNLQKLAGCQPLEALAALASAPVLATRSRAAGRGFTLKFPGFFRAFFA